MNVTRLMSAVTRTVFEACRTLCIWIEALLIHYAVQWKGHGEQWDEPWSCLQLFGFVLLATGTFVYNAILKLPNLDYEEEDGDEKEGGGGPMEADDAALVDDDRF